MKLIRYCAFGSMLITSLCFADGFGFNLGPFSMQFNVYADRNDYRATFTDPFCFAIAQQKQIEMVVEGTEKLNAREIKIVTKKLIVEPYAFAIARDGKPLLNGNVAEEKLVREVTVKYGEDRFEEETAEKTGKGFFSGLFNSDKSKNIDIRRVSDIRIIENSHFDAPKDFKGLQDNNVRVICQLPFAH